MNLQCLRLTPGVTAVGLAFILTLTLYPLRSTAASRAVKDNRSETASSLNVHNQRAAETEEGADVLTSLDTTGDLLLDREAVIEIISRAAVADLIREAVIVKLLTNEDFDTFSGMSRTRPSQGAHPTDAYTWLVVIDQPGVTLADVLDLSWLPRPEAPAAPSTDRSPLFIGISPEGIVQAFGPLDLSISAIRSRKRSGRMSLIGQERGCRSAVGMAGDGLHQEVQWIALLQPER